jgi:hypothetical protein
MLEAKDAGAFDVLVEGPAEWFAGARATLVPPAQPHRSIGRMVVITAAARQDDALEGLRAFLTDYLPSQPPAPACIRARAGPCHTHMRLMAHGAIAPLADRSLAWTRSGPLEAHDKPIGIRGSRKEGRASDETGRVALVIRATDARGGKRRPRSFMASAVLMEAARSEGSAALVAAIQTAPSSCAACALIVLKFALAQWRPPLASELHELELPPHGTTDLAVKRIEARYLNALMSAFIRQPGRPDVRWLFDAMT